jgi:hypothetical protein
MSSWSAFKTPSFDSAGKTFSLGDSGYINNITRNKNIRNINLRSGCGINNIIYPYFSKKAGCLF